MHGTHIGRRYHASKHFYRFIRPGARMVEARSDDADVAAAAFEHARLDSFVSVLINTGYVAKRVSLEGSDVPFAFAAHVTTAERNLGDAPSIVRRDRIVLPPRSVTTLIDGTHLDRPPKPAPNEHAGKRH